MAKKYIKLGTIWKNKEGKPGSYFQVNLEQYDKDKKEKYTLENFTLKPGMFLNVSDPRKNPYATPERLAKIPDGLLAEVDVAVED